jgi:hypothetical protein
MKLTDRCDKYSIHELRTLGSLVVEVARKVLGHGNKPTPSFYIRNNMPKLYGQYCYSHKIFVNPTNCETINYFVGTILHEYTHHIQKGLKKNYDSSVKKYGYNNCPFEIEAISNAKKYKKEVWKKVKQLRSESNS